MPVLLIPATFSEELLHPRYQNAALLDKMGLLHTRSRSSRGADCDL